MLLASPYRSRLGIAAPALVMIGLLAVMGTAAGLYAMNATPHYRYIANVTYTKIGQSVDYNYLNIIKDGAVVAGLGAALTTCVGETLGLCAAAVPTVGALINAVKDDPIMTVEADVVFTNSGNGTASNVQYAVETTSQGNVVSVAYYDIPSIAAGQSVTTTPTYTVALSQIPAALWNAIQGRENLSLSVTSLTYDGGA